MRSPLRDSGITGFAHYRLVCSGLSDLLNKTSLFEDVYITETHSCLINLVWDYA